MAFSILTDDTKAKLEQERERLMTERQAIIDAAVAQATAEVDQMLQNLNQLLGYGEAAPAVNGTAKAVSSLKAKQTRKAAQPSTEEETPAPKKAAATKKAASTSRKAAAKVKTAESAPQPKAKAPGKKAANKAYGSESKPAAPSKPLELKKEFKSVTPTQAVQQIMERADSPLTTDDVIQSLYQSVKESDLATARKSVALILGRGAYQGIYEKVQENPSRFQLKAEAEKAAV